MKTNNSYSNYGCFRDNCSGKLIDLAEIDKNLNSLYQCDQCQRIYTEKDLDQNELSHGQVGAMK